MNMIARRSLLESANRLVKSSPESLTAKDIHEALDALGLVISDLTGSPINVVMVIKPEPEVER